MSVVVASSLMVASLLVSGVLSVSGVGLGVNDLSAGAVSSANDEPDDTDNDGTATKPGADVEKGETGEDTADP